MLETLKSHSDSLGDTGMDVTIDNQQRSIEDRLHWLGGIIDGEGWISARKTNYAKHITYNPVIGVINTDPKLVDEIKDILRTLEIPYYVESSLHQGKNSFTSKKTQYRVLIIGMKRCLKAIPFLLQSVYAKRHKLQAMKEWIEYRLTQKRGCRAWLYTPEDERLLNIIRETPIPPRDYTPTTQLCAA